MGTPRGGGSDHSRDNGGSQPPERGGVPGLPPEWGSIIIPDDAAALDAEATPVRRHFRRELRRARLRSLAHREPQPPRRMPSKDPGLLTPMLIMSTTLVIALISLIAIGWPPGGPRPNQSARPAPATSPLPEITLPDQNNHLVRLGGTAPAVLLLISGCTCDALVDATIAGVAPTVTVVKILIAAPLDRPQPPTGAQPPPTQTPPTQDSARRVLTLLDPRRSVRAAVPTLIGGMDPSAILLDSTGDIIRVVPTAFTVDDFAADLPRLVP
jgi:hypothetical protein